MKLYPESKNVQIVGFEDKVSVVETKAKVFGNVVVGHEGKRLGILYLSDMEKVNEDKRKAYQDEKLKKFLKDLEVKDHITGQTWTVKGLVKENYAR